MGEVDNYIDYCVSGFYFIGTIWITLVQFKRFIHTIKKQYIDWILASWWLLLVISCVLMLTFFVFSCLPYKFSDEVILTLGSLHSLMFALFFWVWLLTTLYPWILSIYISKLSLLQKNRPFSEVKKAINFWELFLIALLFTISAVYITSYTAIWLWVYFEGCTKDVYVGGIYKEMSDKCTRLFWINFSKDCVDLFIATTLFFLQLFTYKRLINLMQSRLHALYQQHKKRTLILYVSSSICFFFRILYVGFYVVVRVDRLEAYID